MAEPTEKRRGDLTVTALYTAQTWKWARLVGGNLFGTWRGRDVFNATNLALGIARLFRPGLPSLRHSLAQRHIIIDHVLGESGCGQVLELAAGLSRRGAATTANATIRYTEVDLPAVVELKRRLLERTAQGRAVSKRPNLCMIEGDLFEVELAELVESGPVCVIAEGIVPYLDATQRRTLWRRVSQLLAAHPNSTFVFDFVPTNELPQPGRLGLFLERLFKIFTRGTTFAADRKSRQDIMADLQECGFARVEPISQETAPSHWKLPFKREVTQTLVFRCQLNG